MGDQTNCISFLEDIKNCMVCFEEYNDEYKPHKLPCDHNLCGKCVDRITHGLDVIRCPLCQKVGEKKDIRTDFRTMQFLDWIKQFEETMRRLEQMSVDDTNESVASDDGSEDASSMDEGDEPRLCCLCEMYEANNWCRDCNKSLCISCSKAHPKMPGLAEHRLQPLVDAVARFAGVLTVEMDKVRDHIEELRKDRDRVISIYTQTKRVEQETNNWIRREKDKCLKTVATYFRRLQGTISVICN